MAFTPSQCLDTEKNQTHYIQYKKNCINCFEILLLLYLNCKVEVIIAKINIINIYIVKLEIYKYFL